MNIIQGQNYSVNNLVAQSGKFKVADYQNALMNMINTYKEFSNVDTEIVITTTKGIEVIKGEQIMEVEFMMPINCSIQVKAPFVFKKLFKLSNALYAKVDDVSKLQENLNVVDQYIVSNKLEPITSAYFIQKKCKDEITIEIYVGINPNIL